MAQQFASDFLNNDINMPSLIMGDMYSLPLVDNAVDIVFTRQAIEPNGGHELEMEAMSLKFCKSFIG